MQKNSGYYRYPCLTNESLFFVCENDIWHVTITGGAAKRLTSTPGIIRDLYISPDGNSLAYSAGDYGSIDVYCMSLDDGFTERLTHYPSSCNVVGWHKNGNEILFCSNLEGLHEKDFGIYSIPKDSTYWQKLNFGLANRLVFDPNSENILIQRGYNDPAAWKCYTGGRTGKLWWGNEKQGFKCLSQKQDSHATPMIHNNRIYFLADINEQGNIYSFDFTGSDLQQHTFHEDYYVRWPNYYNGKICYHLGGDIWILELTTNETNKINISLYSCGNTLRQRFVNTERNLTGYQLSPNEEEVIVTTRGQLFHMKNWVGGVKQLGKKLGRYRHAKWLADGENVVYCIDSSGEEEVVVYSFKQKKEIAHFKKAQGNHIDKVSPAPIGNLIAIGVESSLFLWDFKTGETEKVDESKARYIKDFSWSHDGSWLAYSKYEDIYASIFLYDIHNKKITQITTEETHDYEPCFAPNGKYLYFLSKRTLNPHADTLQMEYNFPATTKPYVVVLNKDEYSPFSSMEKAKEFHENEDKENENEDKKTKNGICHIDTEGIMTRIEEIPIKEGLYWGLSAYEDKIFLLQKPIEGKLSSPSIWQQQDDPKHKLICYDLKTKNEEVVVEKLTTYSYAPLRKKMILCVAKNLCIVKIGTTYKKINDKPGEKTGWLDLRRIKTSIIPQWEWKQMFLEAWRLQRDFFWDKEMSGLNWEKTKERYLPIVDKIRTRNELTDLLIDMQGDLRTSHAYCAVEEPPIIIPQRVAVLGAQLKLENNKCIINKFYKGDFVHEDKKSPLLAPGLGVEEGDVIVAINEQNIDATHSPYQALINQAKQEVDITISKKDAENYNITVKTLPFDSSLRYLDWVRANREYIKHQTNNQIGYLHIPDMGTQGLISFYRDFLWQYSKQGLIVDVRFNGGGHISPILLSKLQKKSLGYVSPRRGKQDVYPRQSLKGPIVALCNEYTGSDGDMFCHTFKTLKIGTLIGTTTWGGVVGIIPDKKLADGSIVTQPEFAFFFGDNEIVNIENKGVDPNIIVENDPQSYINGKDLQLDTAIKIIMEQM